MQKVLLKLVFPLSETWSNLCLERQKKKGKTHKTGVQHQAKFQCVDHYLGQLANEADMEAPHYKDPKTSNHLVVVQQNNHSNCVLLSYL